MAKEGNISEDATVGDSSPLLASTLQGRNKDEEKGEHRMRAASFLVYNHCSHDARRFSALSALQEA